MDHQKVAQPLLAVEGISRSINNNPVLQSVSFRQYRAQKIAIAGETGSGKSTLLKAIGGLVQPDAGKIYFEERRVMGPDYQLVAGEAGIAYLSQHYELRNHYRMEELLSYANQLPEEQAKEIYAICRIDHLLQRNTFQLSGGEKQRIALARLLVGAPRLLLLDEPFSNLDLIHKHLLKEVIDDVARKLGITCLLTSHDPLDTLSWADELIILKEGRIVQQGTPSDIYHHPSSEYVAGLLGVYNIIDPELARFFEITTADCQAPVIVQPQYIAVLKEKVPGSIPALVQSISFHGIYYLLTLDIMGRQVIAALLHHIPETGTQVYVSIAKDSLLLGKQMEE